MRGFAVLCTVVWLGVAHAGEQPGPDWEGIEARARVAAAAHEAKDVVRLREIAAQDDVSPWDVADALVASGRTPAAAAFAGEVRTPDRPALVAYVASLPIPDPDAGLRPKLAAALAAERRGAWAEVLESLGTVAPGTASVPAAHWFSRRARALAELGANAEAHAAARRALELAQGLGWQSRVAVEEALVATALGGLDRAEEARAVANQAREHAEAAGTRAHLTETLHLLGPVYWVVGLIQDAKGALRREVALRRGMGEPRLLARALDLNGKGLWNFGEYGPALSALNEAAEIWERLGMTAHFATTLVEIGWAHAHAGDHDEAIAVLQRTLRMARESGDGDVVRWSMMGMATSYILADDFRKALTLLKLGRGATRGGAEYPIILSLMAYCHLRLGEIDPAHELSAEAIRIRRAEGQSPLPRELALWGVLQARKGDLRAGLASLDEALRIAEATGDLFSVAAVQAGRAMSRLRMGDVRGALAASHGSVEAVPQMAHGLGEEEAPALRRTFADTYTVGVWAAARANDPAEAAYFLDGSRAGALLVALGGRDALSAVPIPDAIREAAAASSVEVRSARDALRVARNTGVISAVQEAMRRLDAALQQQRSVVERLRREQKSTANLLYPRAATIPEMQRALREDEALLLYGLGGRVAISLYGAGDEGAVCLVVTAKDARIVTLANRDRIDAACSDLSLLDPESDVAAPVARLQELVAAPLGLAPGVRRILVSPDGRLQYVPFAVLFPDREVAYSPSGAVHALLRGETPVRGEKVLALGDPVYDDGPSKEERTKRSGHGRLVRLPATAEEARAVGDEVLVAERATETELAKALAKRPRWRAVHLACHGLVNPEQPTLSSLALTADAESDGFLTMLELLQMKVPADLVVLSACETGKGRVFEGEGIVGLTRAFMYAGAPRVLVSLWEVDDEATLALMKAFYARWRAGASPAAALRGAQEVVRSEERWRHPAYWAAWVLWGLPDESR